MRRRNLDEFEQKPSKLLEKIRKYEEEILYIFIGLAMGLFLGLLVVKHVWNRCESEVQKAEEIIALFVVSVDADNDKGLGF